MQIPSTYSKEVFVKQCECVDWELPFTFPQWYYYVRQRDKAEEWKCQPNKWLSPDLERHEILLGSLSLMFTSTLSALLTCYLSNGGWSTVYYEFDEYTWIWWFLQWPVIFIYQVRNCNEKLANNPKLTYDQTLRLKQVFPIRTCKVYLPVTLSYKTGTLFLSLLHYLLL
jgi:hypothetical protein